MSAVITVNQSVTTSTASYLVLLNPPYTVWAWRQELWGCPPMPGTSRVFGSIGPSRTGLVLWNPAVAQSDWEYGKQSQSLWILAVLLIHF